MPTEDWLVSWKRNRNNRDEAIVHSLTKALNLAEEKKALGYKVALHKVSKKKKK
ncbi:hypothetical protein HZB06_01745 [Candidatus Wolfebacteria bacterium]|nr:hypothetical protein [Candidatus Wolfebacteria bacterium]